MSLHNGDLLIIIFNCRVALTDKSEDESLWKELIEALEALLEEGREAFQPLRDEQQLLLEIADAHHQLCRLNPENKDLLLLDWAIASKRSGNIPDCIRAHQMRMAVCPRYRVTDAVRLLGMDKDVIQEIPARGIFEQYSDETSHSHAYRPSRSARDLGRQIQRLFQHHGYTLKNCTAMLIPLLESDLRSPDRIFSATSFFQHRHDLDSSLQSIPRTGLEVLARLFLFGLAVPRNYVRDAIGQDALEYLRNAGLLVISPARSTDLVGEVQLFPISPSDLFHTICDTSESLCCDCYFMTDWPMESLRLTKYAVMSVGYDTLELMSLSAAVTKHGRLLDMCCGCGIQGIFAMLCNPRFSELVCSDVNERACRFATANMALNMNADDRAASVVQGDLFENVNGIFSCIVSNPPFVAVPSQHTTPHTAPALYAVGGGVAGTDLLRRMVRDVVDYVHDDTLVLMVTEVPNIESSCSLVQSFLPDQTNASIQIAYVVNDVESVQHYAAVREAEASTDVETRDWALTQLTQGILNRALALISISSIDKRNAMALHPYRDDSSTDAASEEVCDTVNDAKEEEEEEEDVFLTRGGIQFTRACLLTNS